MNWNFFKILGKCYKTKEFSHPILLDDRTSLNSSRSKNVIAILNQGILLLTLFFADVSYAATDDRDIDGTSSSRGRIKDGEYAMRNHGNRGFLSAERSGKRAEAISVSNSSTKWSISRVTDGYVLRKYATTEYLDGGRTFPCLATSKTDTSAWLFESSGEYYTIKNRETGQYLEGVGGKIDTSESLRFVDSITEGAKWRFILQVHGVVPVEIPDVTLDNGQKWKREWCLHQTGGTCASHAVVAVLSYVHGIDGIMPNYLHKFTQLNQGEEPTYDEGLSMKSVMEFSQIYGVPRVPEGKKIEYGTGNPFPSGTTRYAFSKVKDVMKMGSLHGSKVDRIRQVIREKERPVVTGSISTSILGVRMNNHFHPVAGTAVVAGMGAVGAVGTAVAVAGFGSPRGPVSKEIGHALVIWGYDDSRQVFYVKNSWGDSSWARRYTTPMHGGNACLPYEYVESWTSAAYVGWGERLIELDYKERKAEIEDSAEMFESVMTTLSLLPPGAAQVPGVVRTVLPAVSLLRSVFKKLW